MLVVAFTFALMARERRRPCGSQAVTRQHFCQGKRGPGVHLAMDLAGKVRLNWDPVAEPAQTGRARRRPRGAPRTAAAMAGNRPGPVFCAIAAWRSVNLAGRFGHYGRIPPYRGIPNIISSSPQIMADSLMKDASARDKLLLKQHELAEKVCDS